MEALLALLLWFDLGSWLRPAPPAPTPAPVQAEWAGLSDFGPGFPPPTGP